MNGFEVFYRDAWDEVYRPLAAALRNPELAAEATDEAMTRAFERWRSVQHATNPCGWVYRVAYRWAIDQMRRGKRWHFEAPEELQWQPVVHDSRLEAALKGLGPRHRSVVLLRLVEDWSEADVAVALGVPLGTVKSRLSRALDALRKELGDDSG